ncbi:MAG: ATP-binding protein [Deltaproteobacteria bacterium]|nr:ATP-binding protein [Deltaproteobacteria bacterium]
MKIPHSIPDFHGKLSKVRIPRTDLLESIRASLGRTPVTVLTGPRQCGKTTLARKLLSEDSVNYFDLEDPVSLSRLDEPMTAIGPLKGLVVIDEVQRRPDLFPLLRVLADRRDSPAHFLILGSASGDLMRQSSESLAGRMERITIGGFSLQEIGAESMARLWLRGSFPLAYLADSETESLRWRKEFIETLLERDLPQWGVRVPAMALRRFWTLLAHYHGQTWNATEPARALGVNPTTTRRYLDLLTDAHMIRQLQPWHANLKKRQVKSPKIYVRDSGILHALLGIQDYNSLLGHPMRGFSWEGLVLDQILGRLHPLAQASFYRTAKGDEADLVVEYEGKRIVVEIKASSTPRVEAGFWKVLDDLQPESASVIAPVDRAFVLKDKVEVLSLESFIIVGQQAGWLR